MILPPWVYLLLYLFAIGGLFGYVVYQRCTWKIVIGRLEKRLTSDFKVRFQRGQHVYEASFMVDGKAVTALTSFNPVFHGYTLASAQYLPAVFLVHPTNPTNVRLLYLGDQVSTARVWIFPIMAFTFTCLSSWLIFTGLWSSLAPL